MRYPRLKFPRFVKELRDRLAFREFRRKRFSGVKARELKEIGKIFEGLDKIDEAHENRRFAVLGIGNDLKGDDGVGWYVVDKLSKEFGKDENFLLVKTSVPENHVKEIADFAPKMLIIVDAADFGKRPGAIKVIKGYQIKESFVSTHTTPLTLFLRLYQADQPVKKPLTIIGIQKKTNEFGQPMNGEVRKSGDMVAKIISKLYKKGVLDLSLEKEIEYTLNPFKRVVDYFRTG
ncbi:MAG: hydrogenase maturation protease [Candidatus Aenigmarchaeota archaeon]|nr:hydrogenase maturation protease [Candidatus Aenigmarchaeota archaeon]